LSVPLLPSLPADADGSLAMLSCTHASHFPARPSFRMALHRPGARQRAPALPRYLVLPRYAGRARHRLPGWHDGTCLLAWNDALRRLAAGAEPGNDGQLPPPGADAARYDAEGRGRGAGSGGAPGALPGRS